MDITSDPSLDFIEEGNTSANMDNNNIDVQREHNEELLNFAISSDNKRLRQLGVELVRLNEDINSKDKEFKKQLLHIETITMMAKYQLIYIKMENFWKRLERIYTKNSMDKKEMVMRRLQMISKERPYKRINTLNKMRASMMKIHSIMKTRSNRHLGASYNMIATYGRLNMSLSAHHNEISELRSKILDRDRSIKKLKKEVSGASGGTADVISLLKKKPSKDRIRRRETVDDIRNSRDLLRSIQEKNDTIENKLKATERQIFKFISDLSVQIQSSHHHNEHSITNILHESNRNKLFKLHSKIPSNS